MTVDGNEPIKTGTLCSSRTGDLIRAYLGVWSVLSSGSGYETHAHETDAHNWTEDWRHCTEEFILTVSDA